MGLKVLVDVPELTPDQRSLLLKQYDIFVGPFKTYCDLIFATV